MDQRKVNRSTARIKSRYAVNISLALLGHGASGQWNDVEPIGAMDLGSDGVFCNSVLWNKHYATD